MRTWKATWHTATSFLICAAVVVVATLLYPLVLIFFTGLAIVLPLLGKAATSSSGLPGGGSRG